MIEVPMFIVKVFIHATWYSVLHHIIRVLCSGIATIVTIQKILIDAVITLYNRMYIYIYIN